MHRIIADRIESGDAAPVNVACRNIERWRNLFGELSDAQAEWVELLTLSPARLAMLLRDEHGEEAIRLRGNSPFAGVIDQELRLELLRESRAA